MPIWRAYQHNKNKINRAGNSDEWRTQNCPPQNCPPKGISRAGNSEGNPEALLWTMFLTCQDEILFFFSTSVLNNNQFNKVICWTSGPAALVWNRSCQRPEAPGFQLTEWSCLGFHSAPDVQLWLIIFELVPSFFVHTHYKSNILWEITKKA